MTEDLALKETLIPVYSRFPITFVRGEGCYLFDENGKRYLDLLAGIAVVVAGHANKRIASAISDQANTLLCVSNYFFNDTVLQLSAKLAALSPFEAQTFICNSGAEANECGIKLARKWGHIRKPGEKYKIITAERSFHGRTLGTLAATAQPKKREGFHPLPPGFLHAPLNDVVAWDLLMDEDIAAVMIETIQGEGGIYPCTGDFLHALREMCNARDILLILDEIQCGMGRSGTFWAFQEFGVVPDIYLVAKGLANGVPIGACVAKREVAAAFTVGDHGSTFGGNPFAARAALATIAEIEERQLTQNAKNIGIYLSDSLRSLPFVKEVRGRGLMLAVVLDRPIAKEVVANSLDLGLILNNILEDTLRIVPPLIISKSEVDEAITKLKEAFNSTLKA
jgi:predicted acetylornithine/succinylornithine family transaminase